MEARLVPTFLLRLRGEIFSVSGTWDHWRPYSSPSSGASWAVAQYVVLVFSSSEREKESICAHSGEGSAGPCENTSERSWLNVDVHMGLDL